MGIIYSRIRLRPSFLTPSRTTFAFTLGAMTIAALVRLAFHLDSKQRDTERELEALHRRHRSLSLSNQGISGWKLSKSNVTSQVDDSGTEFCETISSSEYDDNIYKPLSEFKAERILEKLTDSMAVMGRISTEKDGLLSFNNFCRVYHLFRKYGHVSLYPQLR